MRVAERARRGGDWRARAARRRQWRRRLTLVLAATALIAAATVAFLYAMLVTP